MALALVRMDLLYLDSARDSLDEAGISALCRLQRRGMALVLLSDQPERWTPTRRSMDSSLQLQSGINRQIDTLGGRVDAVVYLPAPVFGRNRRYRDCLQQLTERFSMPADTVTVFSDQARELHQFSELGTGSIAVIRPGSGRRAQRETRQLPSSSVFPNLVSAIDVLLRKQ